MTEVDKLLYGYNRGAFERPRPHSERYIEQNEERVKAYEAQINYLHELSKRIKEADKNRQQYIDIIDRKLAYALNSHIITFAEGKEILEKMSDIINNVEPHFFDSPQFFI